MQDTELKFTTNLRTRAYKFGLNVIGLTNTLPSKRTSWVISDQLIRSATSIGANLVEGRAASSRLEFKRYNEIALKSANESRYWLALLRDSKLASGEVVNPLSKECAELCNMLASGIIKLKSK